jgi:hypothetical protein
MNNVFVFVVCGAKEHIDTLNHSLKYLKCYSENEFWIVTDLKRNETEINHSQIISVDTSTQLNDHQASIYLKTSLYKYLPKGNNYCYLDTDVIALSKECNRIFDEYIPPILFAADHCQLNGFSPQAIYCGCHENNRSDHNEVNRLFQLYDKSRSLAGYNNEYLEKLFKEMYEIRMNPFSNLMVIFRYFLAPSKFYLKNYYLNKRDGIWYETKSNAPVLYDLKGTIKKIEKNSTYRWNMIQTAWFNKNGENIFNLKCDHLKESIKTKFDIDIKVKNWQHWNGGVFLFNDESHKFLDAWHEKTILIFKDKNWRTRDQGTLIATAWEFGLSKHPILSKKWNFIADYNNLNLKVKEGVITDDNFKTSYVPAFVHVYHNYGLKGWQIWDWVENHLPKP